MNWGEECLRTISLIEALRLKNLNDAQKEEILGELSAVLNHLKIHSQDVEYAIDEEGEKK
jgi:NTP pyrophosphatase (non-canonical NTP hydrolase)